MIYAIEALDLGNILENKVLHMTLTRVEIFFYKFFSRTCELRGET